jgi:hypothetical protein
MCPTPAALGSKSIIFCSRNQVGKMRLSSACKVSAFLFLIAVLPAAQAKLVLDVGPGGTATACGVCGNDRGSTLGWKFRVKEPITVDGIGVWDANTDPGLGVRAVWAALWSEESTTALASVEISDASTPVASQGDGIWRVADIRKSCSCRPGSTMSVALFTTDRLFSKRARPSLMIQTRSSIWAVI